MREEITLGSLCCSPTCQIQLSPEDVIDYIDISSVSNETKSITSYSSMPFSEAPSRARKALREKSILVSTVRPNLNAIAVFDKRTPNTPVASTGFSVLDCKENVDHRFIYHYCKSPRFISQMVSQATGASYPAVNDGIVRSALIPNYSFDEQKKISNLLDKTETIINSRKNELQALDTLIKARFVEMFGNENNPYDLPIINVEDVANVSVGVVIKPAQYYTEAENGIRAFRSLNIGEMSIKDNDWVYFTREGNDKNAKSQLRENDLLIVRSGAPGTACVVKKEYEGCNAIDIIIARPDTEKVNPYYLCMYTNMPHGKRQIDEGTGGAAQQHFNVGKYNKLKLMLPPKEKQDQFVSFVNQIDKSKVAVQTALNKAQLLFDSLMQQYFG